MRKSKIKLMTAALSAALMLSAIGGASSLVNNSGKGEVVQAATEKTKEEIKKIILQKWPGARIVKLQKDFERGRYHWDAEIRNGRYEIEFEVTSGGKIYDIEYDD